MYEVVFLFDFRKIRAEFDNLPDAFRFASVLREADAKFEAFYNSAPACFISPVEMYLQPDLVIA